MRNRPLVLIFSLFCSLFSIDFALKYWAYYLMPEPIVVFSTPFGIDFLIQCVTNRGGAWGMLSSFHFSLLLFRIVVVGSLICYLFLFRHSTRLNVCLTLIITGAFGNVFDSLCYGHVIDMLHFIFWGHSYGIFNLADAMISIGAIGLIFSLGKPQEKVEDAK